MKFFIKKEILEKILFFIIGIVEKKQTLPILGNVCLRLKNNSLTCIGSDLETEVTTLAHDIEGDEGEITVSAKKLYDICRTLPSNAHLQIAVENTKMSIISGNSKFSLQTLNADNFPKLEKSVWQHSFSLKKKDVHHLFSTTAFSMAQQDVRYFLNGLLLEISTNAILTVGTDGHRLAKTELPLNVGVDFSQSIIPRKAIMELNKFIDANSDEEVILKLNSSHMAIESSEFNFISKLIDGRFPDYDKVIPKNCQHHIFINRAELLDVLSRMSIISTEKFVGVSLLIENQKLQVSSHNPDQEKATDELVIDYTGEKIEIGFNANYLIDVLKACHSETVDFGLQGTNTGCCFNEKDNDNTTFVIMPMKI